MSQVSTLQIRICFFCKEDLQNQIFIECNDCSDLEICISCFLWQSESETHLSTHNYRVISKLQWPSKDRSNIQHFQSWSSFEELRFLELLSIKGYGNWEDFATQIWTKSASEIEEFFWNYLLLKIFKGKIQSLSPFQTLKEWINGELKSIIEKAKQLWVDKKYEKTTFFGESLGHMPLRDEFEYEHENEAEILLSEIVNWEDDTEEDDQLKFNLLELYNRRIKERTKRREFLIERDKLDFEQIIKDYSQMNSLEKEVRFELMKYERFLSKDEFKHFSELMVEQVELQQAQQHIELFEQNGIKSFGDYKELLDKQGHLDKYDHDLSQIIFQEQKGRRKGNKQWYGVSEQEQLQCKQNQIDEDSQILMSKENFFCLDNYFYYADFQKIKESLVCYNIRNFAVNKKQFIQEKLPQLKDLPQDSQALQLFDRIFEFLKKEFIIVEDS